MKAENNLSIAQRIIAVLLYVFSFVIACRVFSNDWAFLTSNSKYNLLFVAGALLLIFGTYIAEPYFTKPIDVITNAVAIILALLSIKDPTSLVGYWWLFYASVIVGAFSILIIFTSQFSKFVNIQKICFEVITKIGQSKIVFSVIYLLTLISYFRNEPYEFVFFLTFWIIFITKYIVESFVLWITKILEFLSCSKEIKEVLGEAIGCENPFLYKVEIDYFKHKTKNIKKGELVYISLDNTKGAVGIIVNEKQLLNKKWITIHLLEKNNIPLKINLKNNELVSETETKTVFSKDNAVYLLKLSEIEDEATRRIISEIPLYKNRDKFLGYVVEESDINKIKFCTIIDSENTRYKLLKEGTVINTKIHNEDVLYQIIEGKTCKEDLDKHNIYGYITGIAKKLGRYKIDTQELETVKWLPNIYAPVFFDNTTSGLHNELAIGKLPETNLEIVIKDVNALVTHNTAILGILGIGKSCLTFELIKKTLENSAVKIVCIDITNEYKRELIDYVDENLIEADSENIFNEINDNFEKIHYDKNSEGKNVANPDKSGNKHEYRAALKKDLIKFLFGQETLPDDKKFIDTKRIRIYNPDYHKASKGEKMGFNAIASELSQAEKTRIICEEIFKILMKLGFNEEKKAKILLVFEEAHSLVPEWNSIANEGDKNAVNGTAKMILQGRKYGLGSFIITQRTANISKSILNQCNTIFALRVFDDTGKQFLENYIGSDYSNTLPTLEERYAIGVGKALKLKQPVIIQLNDMKGIRRSKQEEPTPLNGQDDK